MSQEEQAVYEAEKARVRAEKKAEKDAGFFEQVRVYTIEKARVGAEKEAVFMNVNKDGPASACGAHSVLGGSA